VRALTEGEATLIVGVPRLYDALYSGIEARVGSGGRLAAILFRCYVDLCVGLRRLTGLDAGRLALRLLRKRFGPRLRVLASGGAALDPDLATKLEGLGWRVAVGYGLTETAPLLTLNPPDGNKLGSVGRPVPGVEIGIETSAVLEVAARTVRLVGKVRSSPAGRTSFPDTAIGPTRPARPSMVDGLEPETSATSTMTVTSTSRAGPPP
jgi:long-chain acyl-CoA synthetase